MKFKIFEDWSDVFVIMIILVISISAIKYFDSEDIFNAQITSVDANGEYNIYLELETLVSEPLDYEIEILYKRANLVIDSQTISCKTKCLEKIEIKKIFFDKYNVFVRTFHQGRGYEKKLTFNFEEKKLKFETSIPNQIIWESGNLEIPLKIEKSQFEDTQIIIDIFPTKKTELKNTFKFNCGGKCDKTFSINQNILFGEYTANIYSQTDSSQIKFIVLPKNISQSQIDALTPKIPKQNDSQNQTKINLTKPIQNQTSQIKTNPINENSTITQSVKELGISETIINLENTKLNRNYTKLNENLSTLINQTIQQSTSNTLTVIDLGGNEIELENTQEILKNTKYSAIITDDTDDGRQTQIQIKPIIQNVNTLDEIDNLTLREISNKEKLIMNDSTNSNINLKSFGIQSTPNELVTKQIIGKEEKIEEQTDHGFEKTNLTLERLQQTQTNKLVPGIYKKKEKILFADGTDKIKEEYFAYGLITVNTKKPLYKKGELVDFLIVVLDANGFLVENADFKLEITKPNNQSVLLTTTDKQIQPTNKSGVYSTSIYANKLGNYNLYAQVEQYDIIVDIETYFNVVEQNKIPFQILRNVPATIDPWQGPFNNTFQITPQNQNQKYSFTEIFSNHFTNISTNADEITTKNELIYLTWNNLIGKKELFYSAQVPLISPYLYELGKSFVNYKNKTFYENRPWLFAIDPVAKFCDATSPCECGTPCSGGPSESAPDDGTLDSCRDTNTQYEWVNEVTIKNVDGSKYFGTGNLVEACISVRVDRAERVDIWYMDHSANSGTKWGSSGEFGNYGPSTGVSNVYTSYNLHSDDGDHTYCNTFTLSNYVGKHYLRGKQSYQGTANRVCQGSGGYRDQDDISFDVLDKVGPNWNSWTLDNGTNLGNILNIIRGQNISIITNWDRPLQSGQVRHNGDGTNIWFNVNSYNNNQTIYIHQTSNISQYPNLGPVRTNQVRARDFYFNILTTHTLGNREFNMYGITKINQTILSPYIIFETNSSTMSCQVTDENVNVPYQNKIVEFFKNGVSLGTNTTNLSGWSSMSFTTPIEGDYNINCVIYDELAKYYIASKTNYNETKLLTVKPAGADINPPIISNIQNLSATTFAVGAPFKVKSDFTDDISLKEIFVNFTNPGKVSTIKKISAFDNLVAHWNFDKKTSSHIKDLSSNNLDGSFEYDSTIDSVDGIQNAYGKFDGDDDHIEIPFNSKLNPEIFTISLWAKVTGGSGKYRTLISSRGFTPFTGFVLYSSSANRWQFWIGNGSRWRINGGPAMMYDTWTHLAIRYNGSHSSIYVNGNRASSYLETGFVPNLGSDFYLGAIRTSSELYGNLDNIWIYNRSLTDWEINNLYTQNSILNSTYDFEYTGTSEDGVYPYYFGAKDLSDNPTLSPTLNFNAIGVRTFLGAQTTKSLYKVGQSVAMTSTNYISDYNHSIINEFGDTGSIFYDFTSDLQGWSTGTLNAGPIDWTWGNDNDCPNRPCISTTLNGNYNLNTNQFIQSPIHDFSGRSLVKINYFRVMNTQNGVTGTTDRTFLEAFDGSDWDLKVYQDSLGGSSLSAGTSLYSASDLNGLSNTRFRFRLTSNGATNYEGWRVDDINITFTPRVEWNNNWHYYDTNFGTGGNRITALKFDINITSYDNTGSIANSNNNPDLEIQIFNGTSYKNSHFCSLNSGMIFPQTCSFLIKKNDEFLTAWETNTNRNIRIRAINMDKSDSITWSNVKREYVIPSVIENHGQIPINNKLLQQIKNSAGQVVSTIYNSTVNIGANNNLDLSTLGTFIVPFIPFGNYSFYSALTDLSGNVLQNGDDGSPVNDTYPFQIFSLNYHGVNPLQSELYSTNVLGNFTLDETYFSWGGICEYSLDNQVNLTMPNIAGTYFEKTFTGFSPGQHTIQYFCNDVDGDIIASELITFDVGVQLSQDARVKKRVSYINNTNLIRNFLVQLSFENLEGKTLNKTLFDYVEPSFATSNFSLLPTSNKIFGNNFPGLINWWNISLTSYEIKNISYVISTNSTTTIDKTFIVGFQ